MDAANGEKRLKCANFVLLAALSQMQCLHIALHWSSYLQPRASKHFIRWHLNDRKFRNCLSFFFFWVLHHVIVVSSCDTRSAKVSARLTFFMSACPPLVFCVCWDKDFPFMTKQIFACEFKQLKCKMNIQGWRNKKKKKRGENELA